MSDFWNDRIDAYLRNEMNEEERNRFEKEICNNDALRQEVELSKLIINRLANVKTN